MERPQDQANPAGGHSLSTDVLERRIESLEEAISQLLAAAMPIRADGATLQQVARGIPELYDACHSAAIVLSMRANAGVTGAELAKRPAPKARPRPWC